MPGWPRVATHIESGLDFAIYRRFGYLRTRLLLYHQDRLAEMEAKLDMIDRQDCKDKETQSFLGNRSDDDRRSGSLRKALFLELDKELKTYGG